ncbi:MAG: Hsp20/alpha crystallin family protein [Gemmatimonadaceae bacterium]|nr:Hsp20/alpha crystallin family protein [Gemmatimonadaceae bacterium]
MSYRFARPTRYRGTSFDQLFDAVFSPMPTSAHRNGTFAPAVSARESKDRYIVELELPGVSPEQVQVTAEPGALTVKGNRPAPGQVEGESVHIAERAYGDFRRQFRLPDAVDTSKIDATFSHGVLTITLPKREPSVARTIEIRTT